MVEHLSVYGAIMFNVLHVHVSWCAFPLAVRLDEVTVPEFHNTSYIQIPVTHVMGVDFKFELWFRPSAPNGNISSGKFAGY